MQISPECQALSFGRGRSFAAAFVRRGAQDAPQRRYNHFHPAVELVWFRKARAVLHLRGTTHEIGGGQLVYVPSMVAHDFDVAPGATEFALMFSEPAHARRLAPVVQRRLGEGVRLLTPDARVAARVDMIAEWLVDLIRQPAGDPGTGERLLDLLLALAADGRLLSDRDPADASGDGDAADPLERLRRAIELVHADTSRPLGLAEAAQACSLSPAYFSRLFRARMQTGFLDYQLSHRLNRAAELVGGSDLPIAEIAYRTGFASPAHLSARFADRFGLSPRRYRAAARRNAAVLAASVLPGQA
jgi:AraC-like DNA-binding protein